MFVISVCEAAPGSEFDLCRGTAYTLCDANEYAIGIAVAASHASPEIQIATGENGIEVSRLSAREWRARSQIDPLLPDGWA
jgi:hypothetical protein